MKLYFDSIVSYKGVETLGSLLFSFSSLASISAVTGVSIGYDDLISIYSQAFAEKLDFLYNLKPDFVGDKDYWNYCKASSSLFSQEIPMYTIENGTGTVGYTNVVEVIDNFIKFVRGYLGERVFI